jgi:regulation of enolase protein 1 (concanavalin A-like superfamily)
MNAPRILQEVDGDFTVEVKVVAEFQSGDAVVRSQTLPFNGAGLLLWDTDRNYLRLECDAWVTPQGELASYGPLFEYWKDGKNMKLKRGVTRPLYEGPSTYLRITRRDAEIRSDISHDGVTWIKVDSVIAQLPKRIWVGVAAINTSNDPFAVKFTGFKLTGN